MLWGSAHGFPAKYSRGSQCLRIINVKYRHGKKPTLFTIFCCAVCPCEYTEAGASLTPCIKCSYLPQWHWPPIHTHMCVGAAVLVPQMTVQRHSSLPPVKSEPQEWQHWECSDLVNGQWVFLCCTNKRKMSPLPETLQSKQKKTRVSFSGEGTSSIMCWYIGNVVCFNSLVF